MTAAPIVGQGTVLEQRSNRLTSTPITTTVPLTAIGSSTRTCTSGIPAWLSAGIQRAELPTVVVKNDAGIGLALLKRVGCRFLLSCLHADSPRKTSGSESQMEDPQNCSYVPGVGSPVQKAVWGRDMRRIVLTLALLVKEECSVLY